MTTRVQVRHRGADRRPDRTKMALEGWRQWADVAATRGPDPARTRDEARVRDALLNGGPVPRPDLLVALMGTSDGGEWARALALVGQNRRTRNTPARTPAARPALAPAPALGRMVVYGIWRA